MSRQNAKEGQIQGENKAGSQGRMQQNEGRRWSKQLSCNKYMLGGFTDLRSDLTVMFLDAFRLLHKMWFDQTPFICDVLSSDELSNLGL